MLHGKAGGKMSRREEYEKRAEELLAPIVELNGFELVDVEYVKEAGNWYLRGYIDKPGGITVNDCETVSRAFSDKLDENDFIEDSYIMEISSPGLDRPLKKEKDFAEKHGKTGGNPYLPANRETKRVLRDLDRI